MKWQEMHGMDQEEEHHPGRLAGPTERIPKIVHDIIHQDERDAVKDILEEYRIRKPNGHHFQPGEWTGKRIPETWEENKPFFEIDLTSFFEEKKKEEEEKEKEERLMKQTQEFFNREMKRKQKEEEEERKRIQEMIDKGLEKLNKINARSKDSIYPELSFNFNKPEATRSINAFSDKELGEYGIKIPFNAFNPVEEEKSWEMPKIQIPLKTHFSYGDDSDTEAALRRKEWRVMERVWQNAPSGYEFAGGADNTSRVDTECGAFKVTPPMVPGFGPVNDVDSNGVIIPRKSF